LFKAGLKVYKVREAPQGGRDLLARGVLVPGEEPLEMAVEVKHRRVVDRPEVQLALYQIEAIPHWYSSHLAGSQLEFSKRRASPRIAYGSF
jgi:hypothetical protein